jgi:hypothetical protein
MIQFSCSEKQSNEIGYYCGKSREETIKHSSAVIYGVDISPPSTTGAFPIDERTLREIGKKTHPMELIAINKNGDVFSEPCENLCVLDNALDLISQCRNTPGCQIIGGLKQTIFYPFYTSDRSGGHICSEELK